MKKKFYYKTPLITGMMNLVLIMPIYAGVPVWTFSVPNPARVEVTSSSTTTVQYTVTNQSNKPKNLIMKPTAGVSASPCYLRTKGSTCLLTLTVNGSQIPKEGIHTGPVLCEQGNSTQCYQPSQANLLSITMNTRTPILKASVPDLALAVSGVPRSITITNTGEVPAIGLSLNYPSWPSGTSVSPSSTCTNGATLAAGASCTIVITPGAVTTSNCITGIKPTPGVITVSANGVSASINTVVLGYGCQYQGGFVFAIDDGTITTGSIGGKVTSLVDQAEPYTTFSQPTSIIWSSNGSGSDIGDESYDMIPGIDELSTAANASPSYNPEFETFFSSTYTNTNPFTNASFSACEGIVDGACNTNNILTFYNELITHYNASGSPLFTASNGPTLLTNYAAGLCKAAISGYSDWYLPAICEMDPGSMFSPCPPGIENIVTNLSFLIGNLNAIDPSSSCNQPDIHTDCLAGVYWSSTERWGAADQNVWVETFNSNGSFQSIDYKGHPDGVRCIRKF